jgi:hypothetical protein
MSKNSKSSCFLQAVTLNDAGIQISGQCKERLKPFLASHESYGFEK